MVTTVEDLCNSALQRIGYPLLIGNIYEGSRASRAALDFYGKTRDDLLRAKNYPFARRDVLLVAAGQTAPPPWLFEFTWPADCLRVRQIMPNSTGTFPVNDPQPILFTDFNDQRISPPAKAILSNTSPAILIYTAQITDISTWDSNFTEALIAGMARRFVVPLTGSSELLGAEAGLEAAATGAALEAQSNRAPSPYVVQPEAMAARRR